MDDFNWVALVVAVLGGGGVTAAGQQLYNMVKLSREGVSGREDRRRADIVSERDYAFEQLAIERDARARAEFRADIERERRRRITEELINTRIEYQRRIGLEGLPEFPDIDEDTVPTK